MLTSQTGETQRRPARSRIRLSLHVTALALLVLAAIGWAVFLHIRNEVWRQRCEEHLLRIYTALERYEIEKGKLPTMSFYPDNPKYDEDSPLVVLGPYGSGNDMFQCPALPALYRNLGLAYVWNTTLNGTKLGDAPEPVWMMVEISALSPQVPAPHPGGYHILYTDGSVRISKTPPRELTRY